MCWPPGPTGRPHAGSPGSSASTTEPPPAPQPCRTSRHSPRQARTRRPPQRRRPYRREIPQAITTRSGRPGTSHVPVRNLAQSGECVPRRDARAVARRRHGMQSSLASTAWPGYLSGCLQDSVSRPRWCYAVPFAGSRHGPPGLCWPLVLGMPPGGRDEHHRVGDPLAMRGPSAMRSPVICCLSAVASVASESASVFAQPRAADPELIGSKPMSSCLSSGNRPQKPRPAAFPQVKPQFSAPGGIRTRDRLLSRQPRGSAVVLAGRPALGHIVSEREPDNYLLSHSETG